MKKLIALVVVAVCSIAFADDCTWTGLGQTAAWSDADNWSKTPEEGDRALLPSDASVTAVADDMATFDLFSSIDIPESSTLFFSSVTKKITVPFTGKGRFLSNGGSLTFAVNNTAFEGYFAMTNTYLILTKEGGSVNPLGTTNVVWFSYLNSASGTYAFKNGPDAGKGINAVSNEFHFAGDQFHNLTWNNLVTGLNFYGPVHLVGTGLWSAGGSTAYGYNFYGGLFGGGMKTMNQTAGFHLVKFCGGVVSNVTVAFYTSGGYYVDTEVMASRLVAGRNGHGFQFGPNAVLAKDVRLQFGGDYKDGGYFDLNGTRIQCGDFYTDFNNAANENKYIIKSTNPATLTCTGSAYDNGYWTAFRGRLQGEVTFVYDYDPAVHPAKPSGMTGTLGRFTFNGPGSDTTGGLIVSNGTLALSVNSTFSNLTVLASCNTGKLIVNTADIGNAGTGLAVKVADSGTMEIAADVTVAAKTAFVGKWLEPGDYTKNSPGLSNYLTGDGTLTVSEYGGPKGLMLILR